MTATSQPKNPPIRSDWDAAQLLFATKSLHGHWHHDRAFGADVDAQSDTQNAPRAIVTDSRKVSRGDIFLAIKGDNFDGHDYIQTARDLGAAAAIVSTPVQADIPQLVVDDTKLALGALGAHHRNQFADLTVIALTGSSGKTTVKEMLGSILKRIAPTLITRGNLNNDLGAPMMLLELAAEHRFAVMELGANHIGEIAYTTKLVRPDVACVLNIGSAHLGEFGSREGICQTKAEIFETLDNSKTAIVPDEDDFAENLRELAGSFTKKVIGFGKSDVTAKNIELEAEGSQFVLAIDGNCVPVTLTMAGKHNISNALAAAACAHAVGISLEDIAQGLALAKPAKGRLVSQAFGNHELIDDTYNANPHSVRAAAQVLSAKSGHKIMVLGDIAELGDAASDEHFKLGKAIANTGIDQFFAVGEFADDSALGASLEGLSAQAFDHKAELLPVLKAYMTSKAEPCTILFKGSRAMQMETLIDALVKE